MNSPARLAVAAAAMALILVVVAADSADRPSGHAPRAIPLQDAGPTGAGAKLPSKRILPVPELGQLSYRCDRERRNSVTLEVPPRLATLYVTVIADGRTLVRARQVDPGERFTTRFRRHRRQRWRLLYRHQPGTISARVDLRFRPNVADECFTSSSTLVRRHSHTAAAPRPTTGDWRRLPAVPGGRDHRYSNVEGVRVGSRVVFLGGTSDEPDRVRGLALDPRTHRWTSMRPAPLRRRGAGYTLVGAGREAIVWAGATSYGLSNAGAALDPVRNRWRSIARAPLAARYGHVAVWTGERMLVWGGLGRGRRPLGDGASYDPDRDRWRRIARGPLRARALATATWTGREMVVWGGEPRGDPTPEDGRFLRDGAAYDPAADRWRRIARAPIAADEGAEAVWTGERMLVWNGRRVAAYDPGRDDWRRLPAPPLEARMNSTAVWNGERLLVWGGVIGGDRFLDDGAAYSPRARRWRRLPRSPLSPRDRHATVPTSRGMVIFGGCCKRGYISDGALYESS